MGKEIKNLIIILLLSLFFSGCAIKHDNITINKSDKKIKKLSNTLQSLSESINPDEADDLAKFSASYTKILANKYKLLVSPNFQNFLINIGIKKEGYCYNYADDLVYALSNRGYESFKLYRVIHKKGSMFEHSAVLVRAFDKESSGVILDGWRDAGELYYSLLKDDKSYDWKIFKAL